MKYEQLCQEKANLIRRHVTMLSEHLGSVQIICTDLNPDGTTQGYSFGSGDLYARIAAAEQFLEDAEDATRGRGQHGD